MRKETKLKEEQLKELEAELEDLRNTSQVKSRDNADRELEELEAECEKLK